MAAPGGPVERAGAVAGHGAQRGGPVEGQKFTPAGDHGGWRYGEDVVDKPGKGAFYATDLDLVLRTAGVTHLVLGGVTTDVCVSTTMREANDRGYDCLLVSDATASYIEEFKKATVKMITSQGGIVGKAAKAHAVVKALLNPPISFGKA